MLEEFLSPLLRLYRPYWQLEWQLLIKRKTAGLVFFSGNRWIRRVRPQFSQTRRDTRARHRRERVFGGRLVDKEKMSATHNSPGFCGFHCFTRLGYFFNQWCDWVVYILRFRLRTNSLLTDNRLNKASRPILIRCLSKNGWSRQYSFRPPITGCNARISLTSCKINSCSATIADWFQKCL